MKSNHYLFQAVLTGYILYFSILLLDKIFNIGIYPFIFVVIYYSVLSALFKKYKLLSFTFTTFILLSAYLSFIQNDSINFASIVKVYSYKSLPIVLYANVLLPMVFLSNTFDFYKFVREISSTRKLSYTRYLIPILIKRDLILKRYNVLINRLQGRGINSENFIIRFFRMDLWIIPLITTTLIEGIESYEYNLMLNADILKYKSNYKSTNSSKRYSVFLTLSFLLIIIIVNSLL